MRHRMELNAPAYLRFLVSGVYLLFLFFALGMLTLLLAIGAIRLYYTGHVPKIILVAT